MTTRLSKRSNQIPAAVVAPVSSGVRQSQFVQKAQFDDGYQAYRNRL
jgi:hypothetical protein